MDGMMFEIGLKIIWVCVGGIDETMLMAAEVAGGHGSSFDHFSTVGSV